MIHKLCSIAAKKIKFRDGGIRYKYTFLNEKGLTETYWSDILLKEFKPLKISAFDSNQSIEVELETGDDGKLRLPRGSTGGEEAFSDPL